MPEALALDDYLPLVRAALAEDIGSGDATTLALVPEDALSTAVMTAREPLVMAGVDLALASFQEVDERIDFGIEVRDGQDGDFYQPLLRLQGPTRALLTAERTALNFVQRLSGVATLTAQFVQQVAGTDVQILDTRKTTPGWRALEKYAMAEAIRRARENYPDLKIEAEADTIEQAQAAAEAGADIILLDNMSCDELRQAVGLIEGRAKTEASGGVTLETVREIAETGVDYISVGALTHSAPSVDIALDFDQLS